MARTIIPRNDVGQFTGDIPRQIKVEVEKFAKDLFKKFPDVDVFDVENIVSRAFSYQASMQLLAEATIRQRTSKEEE